MYIVTQEPDNGQFHISLISDKGYHLISASSRRSFHLAWIDELKSGEEHPEVWWSSNHNKAFPKDTDLIHQRDDHELIGKVDSLEQALGLIDIIMMLDDEARQVWDS